MQSRKRPIAWFKAAVRILDTANEDIHVVRFLENAVRGTLVHWKGANNIPCQFEECKASVHDWPTFWKGYSPGEWWVPAENAWIPVVIAATANLELQLRQHKLRGQVWTLYRESNGKKNWPMMGRLEEQSATDSLGSWFDMTIPIANLFHPFKVKLDVPNPVAPKVILSPNHSAAPACAQDISGRRIRVPEQEQTPEEVYKRLGIPLAEPLTRRVNGNSTKGANPASE